MRFFKNTQLIICPILADSLHFGVFVT